MLQEEQNTSKNLIVEQESDLSIIENQKLTMERLDEKNQVEFKDYQEDFEKKYRKKIERHVATHKKSKKKKRKGKKGKKGK